MENTKTFEIIFISFFILAIVIGRSRLVNIFRKLNNRGYNPKNNQPLIMAYYTMGLNLSKIVRSKIDGMRYTTYLTTNMPGNINVTKMSEPGTLIFVLELPFNTQAHIIGLSKKYNIDRIYLEKFLQLSGLEEVVLEGDFPEKFSLYARSGQGMQTHYILDPEAMQFAMNFCTNNFWEIAGDEMYIVSTSTQKQSMDLLKDSLKFVAEIRPRFNKQKPGDEPVHHEVPYGEYGDVELLCPICNKPLMMNKDWMSCVAGHGMLINGRYLIEI